MLIKFNLNSFIKVKLKPEGLKHIAQYYEKVGLPFVTPQTDDLGYSTFQLYDFMHIFGDSLTIGASYMYELDVKLDYDGLDEVMKCIDTNIATNRGILGRAPMEEDTQEESRKLELLEEIRSLITKHCEG